MFLAEATRDQCDNVTTTPNDGVEIGNLVYTLYPDSGLVCARDDADRLVAAYLPQNNATATHRWITESGAGIWGEKHSFGPHDPAQVQQ